MFSSNILQIQHKRLQCTYIPAPGPVSVSAKVLYENSIDYISKTKVKPLPKSHIGILIPRIFPGVRIVRKSNSQEYVRIWLNFYNDNKTGNQESTESEANNYGHLKMKATDGALSFCLFTGFQVNGNEVLNLLTIQADGTWRLSVRGIQITPSLVGLSNIKADSVFALRTILNTVKQIRVCRGRAITSKKDINKNSQFQEWTETGNENWNSLRASSLRCQGATSFFGEGELCFNCQNQKFSQSKSVQTTDSQDTKTLILKLFPNASELLIKFLTMQSDICQKSANNYDARSRRWDKDIIQVALSLWNRSPQGYTTLRNSNMVQLPSDSLLQRYKNCFSQHPGLNDKMLLWMNHEATRFKSDFHGGLILDEMSIQEDLKMTFGDCKILLDGLVDLGSTAAQPRILNTHKNDIVLASHVLQFVYLGFDGFRFPFAYYPTTGANAPEMFVIMWEAIAKLSTYDFVIDYVSFDGASNNRTLQMMHFKDKNEANDKRFTTVNPFLPSGTVTVIMDYSHNIKKWRNNIYASGDTEYSTRKLKYFDKYITWEFWIKAYNWDRIHNPVRVHPKLTDEHIFLTKTSKMRNHLAEDVLDTEMLNLMKVYKQSFKNGEHLDGAISMLEKTSVLVKVFRDSRPINDLNDTRLSQISETEAWMTVWEDNVNSLESSTTAEKAKMLMSQETMSDVHSMLKGFTEICKKRTGDQKRSVVPAGINNDVVENFFCQQRTICHGSNSNPSVYQYRYGITSIILGQNAVSK